MKIYDEHQVLQQMVCNRCEKKLFVDNGLLKDSAYEGSQTFGYFSKRDGVTHRFDLCEECYEEWIRMFRIPVSETENAEII
ncbi:MAG: hypothetical protein IJ429_02550 [Lachnospiraceae bacterium]|nr:hypothetical protein [Lachnospiraceae bacterium]